jgi:transcriptional regulator with XRE-family HTH domain
MENHEINNRIFDLLKQKGVSQQEFASAIGVKNPTISSWKNRGSLPTADKISAIASFFNVSTDYLLTGYDRELPPEERLTEACDHKGKIIKLSEEQEAYLKQIVNQAMSERVEAIKVEVMKELGNKKD